MEFDAEANSDLGVGTEMWICVSMCMCVCLYLPSLCMYTAAQKVGVTKIFFFFKKLIIGFSKDGLY